MCSENGQRGIQISKVEWWAALRYQFVERCPVLILDQEASEVLFSSQDSFNDKAVLPHASRFFRIQVQHADDRAVFTERQRQDATSRQNVCRKIFATAGRALLKSYKADSINNR